MTKQELLQELSDCVLNMEDERIESVANSYVEEGYPVAEGIMDGLMRGMNEAADLYESGEYFLTELFFCSDAMYAGLDVLRPHLKKLKTQNAHKVIIGVVEGDVHDIGKNLVITMLEASGFEIIDLGVDVPAERFVDEAEVQGAEIIAMSTFLSTTIDEMQKVMDILEERGLRSKYIVMIGGSATSMKYAKEIGADIFTENAIEAAKEARKAVGIE